MLGRIRLYVLPSFRSPAAQVVDAAGNVLTVPLLRLLGVVRVGSTDRIDETIIDTGAPLSVFPRKVWRRFDSEIEWLNPPPGQEFPAWLKNLGGWTGGRRKIRIGRVIVQIFDLERSSKSLPVVPVIAMFEQEDSAEDRIISGLYGSILRGRRLVVEGDPRMAWLEEL